MCWGATFGKEDDSCGTVTDGVTSWVLVANGVTSVSADIILRNAHGSVAARQDGDLANDEWRPVGRSRQA